MSLLPLTDTVFVLLYPIINSKTKGVLMPSTLICVMHVFGYSFEIIMYMCV